MTRQATFLLIPASLLLVVVVASAEVSNLEALHALMQDFLKVRIEHTEQTAPAAENKPSLKRDLWSFRCGLVARTIGYARYLNQPPDFTGSHPSLANADMGICFGPGVWGCWYCGLSARPLDHVIAEQLGQKDTRGALVIGVEPGSPADDAGISRGDVFGKLATSKLKTSASFSRWSERQRTPTPSGCGYPGREGTSSLWSDPQKQINLTARR